MKNVVVEQKEAIVHFKDGEGRQIETNRKYPPASALSYGRFELLVAIDLPPI